MRLIDKLINQIDNKYLPPQGTDLVVAVSGGVDSVALVHLLLRLANQYDWDLTVAHFDHQLRKTSQRDAEFVQKLAKNLGLDYVSAARKARYDFLQQVARRRRALIVTGHTADDQLETVVMNWLRGGGVRALAGMRDLDNNIWRPLLSITKTQIKEFVRQYQLTYREDETNQQTKFKRNLIRHKVMPTLRLVNPSLEQVLLRNAKVMASLADFVGQETARLYKKMAKSQKDAIWLDLKKLNQLPEFLRNEVILFTIRQLQGHQQDIKKIHLDEVQKIINSAEGKVWKQLPGKLFVSNRYGKIGFSRYRPKFLNR
ncbi:MAG: tRNA(Ile)-lysidine synthase [candidate division Kazan bacterium GW2011_GWA1_44_22]|uniref:tRNA(Ile)-lysidine synthase n=1 Tax=candidate division Kazan bacterium GW2011_GWA1_44_22 TaxID=1620410 RepID=A0A0G1KXL2_UNCK3|nr:MAG: tRNA(Ile)-lysidine synthase [candidate division Kazan bacterium GW2011_GWA1_44_22]